MKILQITKKTTGPANDGEILAIRSARELLLACGHTVYTLAQNVTNSYSTNTGNTAENWHEKSFEHDISIQAHHLVHNLLFTSKPYVFSRFYSAEFSAFLQKEMKLWQADLIWVESMFMIHYIPVIRSISNAPIIIRTHNLEHEIWQNKACEEKNLLKSLYFKNTAGRLKRIEQGMSKMADGFACISEAEVMFLHENNNAVNAIHLPMALPANFTPLKTCEEIPNSLYYIGSLDWKPNTDALVWFIDSVLPLIQQQIPQVQFHVAGKNANSAFIQYLSVKNVHFHGEVKSAAEYISPFQVAVVPLHSGSGMRIKILEAMQYKKAVVATTKALQGIKLTVGTHCQEANTPKDFAQMVVELLTNPVKRYKMQADAYDFVTETYNAQKLSIKLQEFLDKTMHTAQKYD